MDNGGLTERQEEILQEFNNDSRIVGEQTAEFLRLVRESGYSSWMYLQNITPCGAKEHQEMGVALAVCSELLGDRGAFRVHGGGFAGTCQAFVPTDMLEAFRGEIDRLLGAGSCHVLSIRGVGGTRIL